MITIITLMPDGPVVTHHDADLHAGVAYIHAIGVGIEAFIIVREKSTAKAVHLVRNGDEWSLNAAIGYHLIRLHDALNVSGEPLYRFMVPSITLIRLLDLLDERYPAPERLAPFPTANNKRLKRP